MKGNSIFIYGALANCACDRQKRGLNRFWLGDAPWHGGPART
jgi:hypothetical protein